MILKALAHPGEGLPRCGLDRTLGEEWSCKNDYQQKNMFYDRAK